MSKIDLLNWHDGDIRKERKIDKKGKIGMIRNLISFMIIFMFSVGCIIFKRMINHRSVRIVI